MSSLGRRLPPTSAGLARCKSGVSWPWRFPLEASLTEDTLDMLFRWVPSFTSLGLFHYSGDYKITPMIGGFLCYLQPFHAVSSKYRTLLSNISISRIGHGNRRGNDLCTRYGRPGSSLEGSESIDNGHCNNRYIYCLDILVKCSLFLKDHLLVVLCTLSCSIISSIALSDLQKACGHRLI